MAWRGVACHVLMRAFLVLVLGSWVVGVRGMSGPGILEYVSQTLRSVVTPLRPLLPPRHSKRALKSRSDGVHIPQCPPRPHKILTTDDIPAKYP